MFFQYTVINKFTIAGRTNLVITVVVSNQINPITNLAFDRRHVTRDHANVRRLIMLNAAFNVKTTIDTQVLLFGARVLTTYAGIKTIRRFNANKSNQVPIRFRRTVTSSSTSLVT